MIRNGFNLQIFADEGAENKEKAPSLEDELPKDESDKADEGKTEKDDEEKKPDESEKRTESEDSGEKWDDFKYEVPKVGEIETISSEYVGQFIEDAKNKLDLTPSKTKELLDYVSEANKAEYEKRQEAQKEILEGFEKELQEDKKIGGKDFKKNIEIAREGLEWLTDNNKDDIQSLADYGFLKLPAVVRMCHKIGMMNKEGKVVRGKQPEPERDPLKELYPSMQNRK
jgi:hypothetical protein